MQKSYSRRCYNWDALHEEACEEASLLTVLWYREGRKPADMHADEADLQKQVKWQGTNGFGVSITLEELNTYAKSAYGVTSGTVKKITNISDIKREIQAGRPVIVGTAGKILPNPFFKNGGPPYHMLVITGYDDNGVVNLATCKKINPHSCDQNGGVFITNDVGIRQGSQFKYRYGDLVGAVHDWDETNILNGQKAMLVFN